MGVTMPPVIVPLVANTLIVFGVPGLTALSTAIAVSGFVATAGTSLLISVGLSAAINAIQRSSLSDRGGAGAGVNATEMRLNTRQEVPAQRWVYGQVLIGGALFFEESKGTLYYQGFLWSQGPITAVKILYNSQDEVFLGADAPFDQVLVPSSNLAGGPPFVGNLRASVRRGLRTQAIDPLLTAEFPNLDPDTFRQRGVATLVVEASSGATIAQFEELWGTARRPNPLALIRGVPVYDPRDPSQVLPSDPTDPDELEAARLSWKWSNNASLVQADYLWRSDGGRIPLGAMRWDEIADSAAYDDELIGTKSGELIPRHTIDGVVTAGQNPTAILQSMLTANRGFVARRQGRVSVLSSRPVFEPVATITDLDIRGSVEFRRAQPKRSVLNRVRCRFIDPRQEWTTVDGPVRDYPTERAADGDLYEASIDLMWTADHRRAQRLQKLAAAESRLGRSLTMTVGPELLELSSGHVVRVDSQLLPQINGLYRLTLSSLMDGAAGLSLQMSEYDPDLELSWRAPTDEQPFELPELDLGDS